MTRHGDLRASDADRDRTVDRLHKAATEGRIGSDELEQRVSQALKARTYAELEATVTDLPRARERGQLTARRSAAGWAVATVRANPLLLLVVIPALAVTAAIVVAAAVTWMVLMIVLMVVGGRRQPPRPPWAHRRRAYGYGPRRRPRSDWA